MENNPTRILVAVSKSMIKGVAYPSASSLTAFEWLLRKIVRSNSAGFALTVIHVQYGNTDSVIESPDDIETLKRLMNWDWETHRDFHLLQYFEERCRQKGVAYIPLLRKGNPWEVICEEVKQNRPDLLVVGSRGLKGRMGKISEKEYNTPAVSGFCCRFAECPILRIKLKRRERPTPDIFID